MFWNNTADSFRQQLDRQIELAGQRKDSGDKLAADMREQTEVKTRNLLAQSVSAGQKSRRTF